MSTRTVERSLWRIYGLEARYETLKLLRLPMYVIPTLAFPLVFYFLIGVAMRRGSSEAGTYLMATFGALGVMNAALFGFGVAVAVERGQGWMLFKRATPMPPLAWIFGRLTMCLLFSALVVALLFTAGILAGGVRLPLTSWLSLAGVLVSGAIPFAAFGLAVGFWAGPNSAPAVLNLLSLPLAFASGMWMPIQMLPKVVQRVAEYLPPYHYAQLALGRIGMDQGMPAAKSLAVLALFTVASIALAWAVPRCCSRRSTAASTSISRRSRAATPGCVSRSRRWSGWRRPRSESGSPATCTTSWGTRCR